ncbi:helix-turn-helix domain-containing protein [Enterococcus sp.]|uniref:helix-turn-helix domain-containing protein n=1 Tax=Enterococcus sp. TaxID=35783 RepID=UPI002FC94D34
MQFTSEKDFKKTVPEITRELVKSEPITVTWHLKERMKEREISIKELEELTGIQGHTLSRYANNRQSFNTVNIVHIIALMIALRLTDMVELLTITADIEITPKFKAQSKEWKEVKLPPTEIFEIMKKNRMLNSK